MRHKTKSSKNYVMEIAIVIVVLLIVRNLYISMYKNRTYVLKDSFDYEYKIDERAIVVRDEYLYSNRVSLRVDNPTRQAAGTSIGSFSNYSSDGTVSDGDYQKRMDHLQKSGKTSVSIQDIRKNIFAKDFDKNKDLLDSFENSDAYSAEEKEVLINKWKIKENMLKKQGNHMKLMVPGTLNTYVDNYEDLLSYDNIFGMKDDFYIHPKLEIVSPVKKGLKVINGMDFCLLFSVDNKDLTEHYAKGSSIRIEYKKNSYRGIVERSFIKDETTYFVCKFREGIRNFENIRFADIQIINDKKKVFEIKKSSVLKDGNQSGVYVKAPTGVVIYRPIDIVQEKGNTYLVNTGTNGIITVGNKQLTTVAQFDQIFENPNSLKEGELIE